MMRALLSIEEASRNCPDPKACTVDVLYVPGLVKSCETVHIYIYYIYVFIYLIHFRQYGQMKKQGWEESEKRREEKKKEDQRRERVRRKKMQVHEKIETTQIRITVLFQCFVARDS